MRWLPRVANEMGGHRKATRRQRSTGFGAGWPGTLRSTRRTGVPPVPLSKRVPESVLRNPAQVRLVESEMPCRQPVFANQRAAEHGGVVGVQDDRHSRVVEPAHSGIWWNEAKSAAVVGATAVVGAAVADSAWGAGAGSTSGWGAVWAGASPGAGADWKRWSLGLAQK